MGCGFLRAHLEDFPAVVLAEAATELRSQMGAYGILRESARAAASGAGEGGALAADNLGPAFDAEAAAAIMLVTSRLISPRKRWSSASSLCCPWPSSCGFARITRRRPRGHPSSPWPSPWICAPAAPLRYAGV
jgi:hypothetical protein